MKKPLISVLIPVYNREHLIGEAIGSALDCGIDDMEIVVCDNASTDNTYQKCVEASQKDPRIHVFRNDTNLGPVGNWKQCIKHANGKYAKLLFSDDLIIKDGLHAQLNFLIANNVDVVHSPAIIGPSKEESRLYYHAREQECIISLENYLKDFLAESLVFSLSPCAGLFTLESLQNGIRENFEFSKLEDYSKTGAGSDVYLFFAAAKSSGQIGYTPETATFFRQHPGSLSINLYWEKNRRLTNCYSGATLSFLLEIGWFDGYKDQLAKQHLKDMYDRRCFISINQTCKARGLEVIRLPTVRNYVRVIIQNLYLRTRKSRLGGRKLSDESAL